MGAHNGMWKSSGNECRARWILLRRPRIELCRRETSIRRACLWIESRGAAPPKCLAAEGGRLMRRIGSTSSSHGSPESPAACIQRGVRYSRLKTLSLANEGDFMKILPSSLPRRLPYAFVFEIKREGGAPAISGKSISRLVGLA